MCVEVPPVVSEVPTKGDHIAVNADLKSESPDLTPRELDSATTRVTAVPGSLRTVRRPSRANRRRATGRRSSRSMPIRSSPEPSSIACRSGFTPSRSTAREHLHAGRRARPPLPDPRASRGLRWDQRAGRRHLRRLLRVPRRGPRARAGRRGRQRAVPGMGQLALGRRARGRRGFRAIRELLGSEVEYRRMDAFELDELDERFDLVFCFGILHRVENPLGLLRTLRRDSRTAGRCCWKPTARRIGLSNPRRRFTFPSAERSMPVITSSTGASRPRSGRMAGHAGFESFELIDAPVIDGHPRVLGGLRSGSLA